MSSSRTIYFLITLIILAGVRFIVYPELSKYFELKVNLENLERQYLEIMDQKELILELKDKLRELNSKISKIETFQIADYFPEVRIMEKKSEKEICFSQHTCFLQEDIQFETELSFVDLVAFFKALSESREFVQFDNIYLESGDSSIKATFSARLFKKVAK